MINGLVEVRGRPLPRRRALMLGASAVALSTAAHAGPPAFSAGWYALKTAGGQAATAAIANAAAGAGISGKTYAQVQQSLANLQRTASAMVAMQALQSQAHAVVAAGTVPNGLVAGGIVPDSGLASPGVVNPVTTWVGAAAPVQTGSASAPTVTVRQTAASALLNWSKLNVGAHTRLAFDQSAGGVAAPTWVALNRVNDPTRSPTQILGQVTAQGHVVIVNNSGIIFTPTAQVTVGSLIASTASISNGQFSVNGIYSPDATTASFTGAAAPVLVEAGAQIGTSAPLTATSAGGGVILLGSDVVNAGRITTPQGQTILGAGKDFILLPGYGISASNGNFNNIPAGTAIIGGRANTSGFGPAGTAVETVQGTAIAVADGNGTATNTGLIAADLGDVTLVGHTVTQAGVAVSTTSVATRGTIHLLTSQADATASVTLAPGSLTSILPDPNSGTALDAQRATGVTNSGNADIDRSLNAPPLNDQPALPDNQYQSLIQVVSGGTVDFGAHSLTMSQGGQIQVASPGRVLVETGAQLDVSGEVGVSLPMSANQVSVNVQGFELRDNALNRDTKLLNNANLTLTTSDLVTVAPNQAYVDSPYTTTSRLFTPGGLLELSGEVSNVPHTIGEWVSAGGTILVSGGAAGEVVTQPGSVINLAGGSIDYQAGRLAQSWLIGPNGVLYNANTAPSDLVYTGVYGGFTTSQPRWNINQTFNNPLVTPTSVQMPGFTVGRDGGVLEVGEPTAVLEGTLNAGVVDGPLQTQPRTASVTDPYLQPQNAVPLAGQLLIGHYGALGYGSAGLTGGYDTDVEFVAGGAPIAASIGIATPLPPARIGTAVLDTIALDAAGLGTVDVTTAGALTVASPLTLAQAGQLALNAATVTVGADITAHAGSVSLGDVIPLLNPIIAGQKQSLVPVPANAQTPAAIAEVAISPGVTIDVTGRWTNALLDSVDLAGEAATAGGSLRVDTTGGLLLGAGSLIDVSAGGVVSSSGAFTAGNGGSVSLIGDDPNGNPAFSAIPGAGTVPVALEGAVRGFGNGAGGTFALQSPGVLIGAAPTPTGLTADGRTILATSLFRSGFTAYNIDGYGNLPAPSGASAPLLPGIEIGAGVSIQPVVPVYLETASTLIAPTGSNPEAAAGLYLPPTTVQNQTTATLTPRAGASLSLTSRDFNVFAGGTTFPLDGGGAVAIDRGAAITVDPSQAVRLEAVGQITVEGNITAPGGAITIQNDTYEPGSTSETLEYNPDLSIWIGNGVTLDANGVSQTANDTFGSPYGVAPAGGTISIGGLATVAAGYPQSTDAFVILRPGSLLEASGSSVVVNRNAGLGARAPSSLIRLAGNGGSISINSTSGIDLGGTLRAAAGGAGAAGGSLTIDLVTPVYGADQQSFNPYYDVPATLEGPREIIVRQMHGAPGVPSGVLPGLGNLSGIYGTAVLGVDQLAAGGFGSLTLSGADFPDYGPSDVRFDGNVSLTAPISINVPGVLTDTSSNAVVSIAAASVTLNNNASVSYFSGTQQSVVGYYALNNLSFYPSQTATASTLSVNAGQIVVGTGGDLSLGSKKGGDLAGVHVAQIPTITRVGVKTPAVPVFDEPGFNDVSLASSGDIQFNATTDTFGGNLSLTAAQIYPVGNAVIQLGPAASTGSGSDPLPAGTLTINRAPGTNPAPPLTIDGSLTLLAADIEQGGVIRAPLGSISFGTQTNVPEAVDLLGRLNFLPGSITSVSLAGQTALYGGTADGVNYTPSFTSSPTLSPTITIAAEQTAIHAGATLDLSGGGTLAGAAFNSGAGGSTDVLTAPLLQVGASAAGLNSGDLVYAIVPGQTATQLPPVTAVSYAGTTYGRANIPVDGAPQAGEQITLASGVPGLPAGTYTLQPAYDALLPGAFRIELQPSVHPVVSGAVAVGNLSTQIAGNVGIAGTGVSSPQPIGVLLTSGSNVRLLSSYDEETPAAFAIAQAALLAYPRTFIPADAGTLVLNYNIPVPLKAPTAQQLAVDGAVLFTPGAGGRGGTAQVESVSAIDIVAGPEQAVSAASQVPAGTAILSAPDLDRLGAETLSIGGTVTIPQGQNGSAYTIQANALQTQVTVASGAILMAPQIDLIAAAGLTVQQGAVLDTIGLGLPANASTAQFNYAEVNAAGTAALILSNALLTFNPPTTAPAANTITIADGASILSGGTIGIDTPGPVSIGNSVTLAASKLSVAVANVDVVGSNTLPSGAAVPAGFSLNQSFLNTLEAGGVVAGAPKLTQISLLATNAVNFAGAVNLALPANAVLEVDTPSIYGIGGASDVATVTAGTFVWNGIAQAQNTNLISNISPFYSSAPAAPVALNGPGTGQGSLVIDASQIVLGYSAGQPILTPAETGGPPLLGRTTYGFANVTLNASRQVVANTAGTLSVYEAQGAYAGGGFQSTGGNLAINTPLLTAAAGAILQVAAGGTIAINSPGGVAGPAAGLGGEIDLTGNAITLATAVGLPEGKLSLTAAGDIALGAGSSIDLAGVGIPIFDQTVEGPGGTLIAESTGGGITQDPSSVIDVASAGAAAGSISLTATGGTVSLAGAITGGGVTGGSIAIRAGALTGFAALNQALTAGGVTGSRRFEIGTGDLTIGTADAVRASNVAISLDSGSLTVDGLINASGAQPGSISLSAGQNLVLTGNAVLDAHGTVPQTDSRGATIDAENTGSVVLRVADGPNGIVLNAPATAGAVAAGDSTGATGTRTSGASGTLTIAPGATIDVSAPSGVSCALGPCGTVEFDVPRLGAAYGTNGNLAISVPGPVTIAGAGSIAVNGFFSYVPSDGTVVQTNLAGGTPVDPQGVGLDEIDVWNRSFIASAEPGGVLNPALSAELAGLTAYASAFHLRPGVEIDGAAASQGDLTIVRDLDLSGLRYASLNPASQLTSTDGSGEPGVLVLRAANDLNVYGSITDGFAPPVDGVGGVQNPDDNGWVLDASNGIPTVQNVVIPVGADPVDVGGSTYPATPVTLNYALPVASQPLVAGTVLPTSITLASGQPLAIASSTVAQGAVIATDGTTVLYAKGTTIPAGTVLPPGVSLQAGFLLPAAVTFASTNALTGAAQTWPAGASLAAFGGGQVTLASSVPLAPGDIIPAGTNLMLPAAPFNAAGVQEVNLRQPTTLPNGLIGQGEIYGASNLLPPGSLSWSIALISGANINAADPASLTTATTLAARGPGSGALTFSDLHSSELFVSGQALATPAFSVVRTGTGTLNVLAGGSLDEASLYGIYTAGTQSPGVIGTAYDQIAAPYVSNDPTISTTAEANVYSSIDTAYPEGGGSVTVGTQGDLLTTTLSTLSSRATAFQTGTWLDRQGDGTPTDPGAYSVNFGNYQPVTGSSGTTNIPLLVGFAGIGTLGGGNLSIAVGGNAGVSQIGLEASPQGPFLPDASGDTLSFQYTGGLNAVIGGSGRESSNGLVTTGGGKLTLTVGNVLDPLSIGSAAQTGFTEQTAIVDLRGSVSIEAGRIASVNGVQNPGSVTVNPYVANVQTGPDLLLGDAAATVSTRGDLSLGAADDPGLAQTLYASPNGATSWFSLWQPSTAITLFSAGGDLAPAGSATTGQTYYPPTLKAAAASGSIYIIDRTAQSSPPTIELAPSAVGQLGLLAGNSIIGGFSTPGVVGAIEGPAVSISGADPTLLPTIADAAFAGGAGTVASNTTTAVDTLFAFSTDTPTTNLHAGDTQPARFYAGQNIEDLSTGEIINGTQYVAAKAVQIRAGGDIVNLDQASNPSIVTGLFSDANPNDLSVISAGGSIIYARAGIAGSGLLEVSAGGSIDETATTASNNFTSLGVIVDKTLANQNAGAGITVTAGTATDPLDLTAFANLYLNAANLADSATPLQSQPGKVERTYQSQLLGFVQSRGYTGDAAGALAYFLALPPDVQQILVLQVYYAELNQAGLDYTNPASRFYRSYLEGTEAIGTLFPATDTTGAAPPGSGSITFTGGSGITSEFGGNIEIADPTGAVTIGVNGVTPPSTAGVVTQGTGDVDIYSYGSVLLGESRIFTTFGGSILIWLEGNGQINGGQGAKSTIVFTPANIAYDTLGDISLSPTVPSTGAGIAVLAPVAGVPPGDVNLISPFGTINAGEAGIRSSGNVNLVALTVINAANVQAGGKVTGVPTAAVPNVAATNAAAAAAGATANAAQNNISQKPAEKTPSVITVEVVGSGQTASPVSDDQRRKHKT